MYGLEVVKNSWNVEQPEGIAKSIPKCSIITIVNASSKKEALGTYMTISCGQL